jgi:hypothetical protein
MIRATPGIPPLRWHDSLGRAHVIKANGLDDYDTQMRAMHRTICGLDVPIGEVYEIANAVKKITCENCSKRLLRYQL